MTLIVRDDGFHEDDLSEVEFLSHSELVLVKPEQITGDNIFVELASGDDVGQLADYLPSISTIRIRFESFVDGRGFSLAYRLRQIGYLGRLRAEGYIIADQYPLARKSGFDEVVISDDLAKRQPEIDWPLGNPVQKPDYQSRLQQE